MHSLARSTVAGQSRKGEAIGAPGKREELFAVMRESQAKPFPRANCQQTAIGGVAHS